MPAHRGGQGALPEACDTVVPHNLLHHRQRAHGAVGLQPRLEQLYGVCDEGGDGSAGRPGRDLLEQRWVSVSSHNCLQGRIHAQAQTCSRDFLASDTVLPDISQPGSSRHITKSSVI